MIIESLPILKSKRFLIFIDSSQQGTLHRIGNRRGEELDPKLNLTEKNSFDYYSI